MALPEHLQQLAAKVSNWGRWGPDDRRGTLNLIDDAAVRRGLAAARTGTALSLAIPFDEDGPQTGGIPGRDNPHRTMLTVNQSMTGDPTDFCTSDDAVTMGVQAATHWDALAHVGYDGKLYNGVDAVTNDEAGAHELGIEHVGPVTTRGVLVDIARLKGVDHFDDGYPITGEDLDAATAAAGIEVLAGDALLVRTGQMHFLPDRRARYSHPSPGLSAHSIEWLHDHDVAAVATDTLVFEVFPCEDPKALLPVHMIHLRDMGLLQGQNWFLDELADACAADGRYDCLLVASPLPMTRSVGGPVAPVAIR
ncbi:MAG TPA: cyclase family protein [Acidimicrobiales bacterium]|jgi:kynurenine formamidase|nr:cyclase family protein [Acidimicrobiales bacterium]